jgi:hypothetical protein
VRSTHSDFKRDADGSEKQYGFVIPSLDAKSATVMVFESPIDAMSHACLVPGFDGWRLSLCGTALIALEHFLERHGEVKTVIACTDNDEAGDLAVSKIAESPGYQVSRLRTVFGKDFNELLFTEQKAERQQGRGKSQTEAR